MSEFLILTFGSPPTSMTHSDHKGCPYISRPCPVNSKLINFFAHPHQYLGGFEEMPGCTIDNFLKQGRGPCEIQKDYSVINWAIQLEQHEDLLMMYTTSSVHPSMLSIWLLADHAALPAICNIVASACKHWQLPSHEHSLIGSIGGPALALMAAVTVGDGISTNAL